MMGSSRVKEGERNERAVRALLKLPGNRRCINCNSMGPQYVCTSFSTFICTNCSGIHREFTHRVKSISMAKFTSQEVSALQEGGNERAKGIYFKHLDFQGQSVPDSSDVDWLRNFIKNVYVGQRYTGKRVGDHPPQAKGIQAASYGNHDADSSSGVLRGPYGGTSEDNHGHQHIKGSTSGNQSNVNRHPIDDIMDEKNRYTMGKESANVRKRPDEFWKTAGSSENIQKDVTTSLSSAVEPSKDTTRVVLPVRLPNPPMSHKATPSTTSSEAQKVEPPRAGDPSPKTTRDVKVEMPKSLIDFDSDLEPHQGGAQAKIQNNSSLPSADVGWATFDVATPKNAISTPQSSFPTMQTAKSLSFPQTNHGGQQQQLFMFPVDNAQSYNAHLNGASSAPVSTQGSGAASDAPMQGSSALPSNHGSNILRGTSDPVILLASQQPSAEVASNGRKALPEDIFTMSYRPAYASTWDWRAHPRVNMGYGQYGVQYPVGTINTAQSFAHPNSLNSFNMSRGPLLVHAPTFPSLSSMQGPLPDMGSMSYVPSMASVLTSPQVPFSLTTNNNQFMVQQHAVNVPHHMQNNNFPVGYEGFRGFATTGSAYSISSMDQHMDAKSLRAIAQSSLPRVGGNPFA